MNTNMSAIWKELKIHQGIISFWQKLKTAQGGQNPEKIQKSVKNNYYGHGSWQMQKIKTMKGAHQKYLSSILEFFREKLPKFL